MLWQPTDADAECRDGCDAFAEFPTLRPTHVLEVECVELPVLSVYLSFVLSFFLSFFLLFFLSFISFFLLFVILSFFLLFLSYFSFLSFKLQKRKKARKNERNAPHSPTSSLQPYRRQLMRLLPHHHKTATQPRQLRCLLICTCKRDRTQAGQQAHNMRARSDQAGVFILYCNNEKLQYYSIHHLPLLVLLERKLLFLLGLSQHLRASLENHLRARHGSRCCIVQLLSLVVCSKQLVGCSLGATRSNTRIFI